MNHAVCKIQEQIEQKEKKKIVLNYSVGDDDSEDYDAHFDENSYYSEDVDDQGEHYDPTP